MIGFIQGKILIMETQSIIVDVLGLGYQVFLTKSDLEQCVIGQDCKLYVHTSVKEDAIDLYGFFTAPQKDFFLLLNSVNGVGKKTAMNILSHASIKDLTHAIMEKNISFLSSVQGIGKKTAERIALELKEKVAKLALSFSTASSSSTISNLTQAMAGLGYSKEQAQKAFKNISSEDFANLAFEDLLRKTIKILSGSKAV